MNYRLIIAEKPSMMRAIAEGLGVKGKTGKGFIQDDAKGLILTSGVGHLVELEMPESYADNWDWNGNCWEVLPMVPKPFKTRAIKQTMDQWKVVKEFLGKPEITEVVNATDAGREGELIFAYIYEKAKCKKPVLRFWASSLTDDAVQAAYKVMKPWSAYNGLTDAAKCRSEADWLVGINGTRALTLYARSKGHTERGAWNVGRVMTPTLALIVNREMEIQNFQPEDYFTIEGTFSFGGVDYKGKWFRGQGEAKQDDFPSMAEAQAFMANLRGKPAKLHKATTRPTSTPPQQLFDLTSLQQSANNRFGFTAEKTLGLAQSLYEKKYLSYPRTNSSHLTHSDAAKIPTWLDQLVKLPTYEAGVEVARARGINLGPRFVDDKEVEDHTALVPTDQPDVDLNKLSPDEKTIYDMVVRRFLGAFYPNLIEAKSVVLTEVEGELFKSTGTAVIEAGWTEIDVKGKGAGKKAPKGKDQEEDAARLPPFKEEDKGAPVAVKAMDPVKRTTKPPGRLSEDDLLDAMKKAGKDLDDEELRGAMKDGGLGTPATRATTIEKIVKSEFATREGKGEKKVFVPTEKGMKNIALIPNEDLKSPELTGAWEARLEKINRGELGREAFINAVEDYTRTMIAEMQAHAGPVAVGQPRVVLADCPVCSKGKLQLGERKAENGGGYYARCSHKPCGVYASVDAEKQLVLREAPCQYCDKAAVTSSPWGDKCMACEKTQGTALAISCDKCGSPMVGLVYEGQPYAKCMEKAGKECKNSWYTTDTSFQTRKERERPQVDIACLTCGSPMEAKYGKAMEHYLGCTKEGCKTWWPTDETYKRPRFGLCKQQSCDGPLRPTKEHGNVCTRCGKYETAYATR